jgi:hypothetical protein
MKANNTISALRLRIADLEFGLLQLDQLCQPTAIRLRRQRERRTVGLLHLPSGLRGRSAGEFSYELVRQSFRS